MRGAHQVAAGGQVLGIRRQVPVGEVADKLQQRLAQV